MHVLRMVPPAWPHPARKPTRSVLRRGRGARRTRAPMILLSTAARKTCFSDSASAAWLPPPMTHSPGQASHAARFPPTLSSGVYDRPPSLGATAACLPYIIRSNGRLARTMPLAPGGAGFLLTAPIVYRSIEAESAVPPFSLSKSHLPRRACSCTAVLPTAK